MQPYTTKFFGDLATVSSRSAHEVVPFIVELIHPSSVLDVGCGSGTWLAVFQEHGVADVFGIDGDYVDRKLLEVPLDRFQGTDLTKPFRLERQFDLAISLEVGEHLPDSSAAGFVESLVRVAPVIVFSAAVPGQGGVAHINEQWPEYWRDHFAKHDYVVVDCLREKLWSNDKIMWHYRQNALVFVRSDAIDNYPELKSQLNSSYKAPLNIVHPDMYTGLCASTNPQNIPLGNSWGNFMTSLSRAVRSRLK